MTTKLTNLSDIRGHFVRNDRPVLFFSATCFNLIGMDEWVRSFRYLNYIDCFDGQHPQIIAPTEVAHRPFTSIEDINNYLLEHKDVVDYVRSVSGRKPMGIFLMFDERTEELCEELGIELCFPSAKLRREIDDKIATTRIGDRAGIRSVPNVLAEVKSYEDLRKVSADLGDELVVQTAFGDSGHTTFFIANEADYDRCGEEIAEAGEVKVMKRINCRGSAQEACVTRHGTIVGPLMTELVGFPELTPYRGGWCGNEVLGESFDLDTRQRARTMTAAFGEELRKMGYRGYFELDFLRDLDTNELYLGEVNPRITGASAMTNLAAFAHADAPLFLFHLLEFSGVDFELDVEELNERWADPKNIDSWSQMVIKCTSSDVELVSAAPPSGIYHLDADGSASFVRAQIHRRTVERADNAFFLRITRPGDWLYEGADLGILTMPGRMMNDDFELEDEAKRWIRAIKAQFHARPPGGLGPIVTAQVAEADNFKML